MTARLFSKTGLCAAALAAVSIAPAQTPPTSESGGVPAIPTDAPPTGPRMPLPAPLGAAARPDHPLARSPKLADLGGKPLTIRDAVAIALGANPALAQAGENLALAQGRVKEARSGFNPTISVGPSETYIARTLEPGYGVQATMPIDISRMIAAATEQAHYQEIDARLNVNRVRNEVAFDVEGAFYAVLRAKALVKVADENLQNSLDRLKDAQVRYKARAVAYFDVVRAQTDVADAQKQAIAARSRVSDSLAVLANAMGVDVGTPLQVSETGAVETPPGVDLGPLDPAPTDATSPPQVVPNRTITTDTAGSEASKAAQSLRLGSAFQRVLDEALQGRPEILEADAEIAAARKGVALAHRSDLPSLSLGVGYFDLRSTTGTRYNEPQAFVGLNLPVFDGGLTQARVQEARATVASAITAKRERIDDVTLDVRRAYLALVQARDEVAVAGQALAQARIGFDLARFRYNTGVSSRAGISPLLEVSDAQAALTLAEQNQVNALYDYNDARAQLDRAAGRFAYLAGKTGG